MEKSPSIFIKIDEFIFQKLDLLKNEGFFQKLNDALSGLEESQQKLAAQITTFTMLLLPFIFVLILFWGNYQTKKEIEAKKQIIEQIALLDSNKTALNNISANYLAPAPIASSEDLDNKVRNILSLSAIDQGKVVVNNFHQISNSSSISKIEADVNFKEFGTSDFANFMRGLMDNEKFKIVKVNLSKDKETSLLNGSISLLHMGQNTLMPE